MQEKSLRAKDLVLIREEWLEKIYEAFSALNAGECRVLIPQTGSDELLWCRNVVRKLQALRRLRVYVAVAAGEVYSDEKMRSSIDPLHDVMIAVRRTADGPVVVAHKAPATPFVMVEDTDDPLIRPEVKSIAEKMKTLGLDWAELASDRIQNRMVLLKKAVQYAAKVGNIDINNEDYDMRVRFDKQKRLYVLSGCRR